MRCFHLVESVEKVGYKNEVGHGFKQGEDSRVGCLKGNRMTMQQKTRRDLFRAASMAGVAAVGTGFGVDVDADAQSPQPSLNHSFLFALNTSTISGFKPTIVEALDIVAKAGYDGIEPWIRELDAHVKGGGTLDDLGKQARDLNLKVVDAIGFFEWAVDDESRRAKALEEARRNMEMVARIGGTRIAAPATGATDKAGPKLDLDRVAERYRTLLDLGKNFEVTPIVEVWGFSKNLQTLADAAHVAIGANHPDAAILADVYHLHKGGSGFAGLRLLGPGALPVLHMNDYPDKPREALSDADRVYPGDGVAPLATILRTLRDSGAKTALSLELFNRDYWKLDPATVATTGLAKMRAAVASAIA